MKFTPLNSGLLLGLINVVLYLIIYMMGPETIADSGVKTLFFVLNIGLLIFFGIKGRKQHGGYFSYGQAFKFLFITILIMNAATIICNGLIGALDPEVMEEVKTITIDEQVEQMESRGAPEEAINATIDWMEGTFEFGKTFLGQLVYFLIFVAVWSVISLLAALIVKKNKPQFAEE